MEQLVGGNGELKAALQYLSRSFRVKDPSIKDLFIDILIEELSYMEKERILNHPLLFILQMNKL